MKAQPLFRGSISVEEQANGYYTVRAGKRQTGEGMSDTDVYPNLSWAEVETLIFAVVEDWSTARLERHQVVLATGSWIEMSLF